MTIKIRAWEMPNGMTHFEFHSGQFKVVILENGSMEMDDYECYSFKADTFNDEIRKVFEYTGQGSVLLRGHRLYNAGTGLNGQRVLVMQHEGTGIEKGTP